MAYRQSTENLKSYMQRQWSLVGGIAGKFREMELCKEKGAVMAPFLLVGGCPGFIFKSVSGMGSLLPAGINPLNALTNIPTANLSLILSLP